MRAFLAFLCLAIFAAWGAPACAAVTAAFSFPVARAAHPLAVDASLADPAWQAGKLPESGPWENLTTRAPAAHATTVYLLYDDRNLYVGFQADQAGTRITATQSADNVGFGIDDFVGIGIDSSGTGQQAYFFETTPHGIRYQQASENTRYQPRWQSAAVASDGNWSAVMVIPLRVMRLRPGAHSLRITLFRQIAGVAEHYTWTYDGLMADSGAGNWPTFADARFWAQAVGLQIHSSTTAGAKARADLFALSSVGSDRRLYQQADGTFAPQAARPLGLDVSYPLTSTVNFVGTLNPDFSNVEVDQETVAPQEFRRALQEYRPFFSQGAGFVNANSTLPAGSLLAAPSQVFYSPDIGPFDHGAKVEGTFGNQSFGLLNFRGADSASGDTFDDVAFGYKHALQDRTFLYWADGVMAHHSIAGNDTTIETGAEGRDLKSGFVWAADHSFETGSWIPQGSADTTSGFVDVHKPNYEINFNYSSISPNYNPIDGFTANSDIRGPGFFADFTGSGHGLKNWVLFVGGDRYVDQSGAVHQLDTTASLNATFKNGFSLDGIGPNVGLLRRYDVLSGPGCSGTVIGSSYFTGFPCYEGGATDQFNLMTLPIGYRDGTPEPIDASAAWGRFGSNEEHLYSTTTTRPLTRRLTLGLEYDGSYQRSFADGSLDSQWLRRVSLGFGASADSSFTLSLRSINGTGGFSTQLGTNLAAAYQQRFRNGDELYVNFGTPAAQTTLNRLIVKFIFHQGADLGT